MQTNAKPSVVASLLARAGGLLAAVAAALGCASFLLNHRFTINTVEPKAIAESAGESRFPAPGPSLKPVVEADVQVAVAEVYALSADDWHRTLAGLAANLHLGLTIEVALPTTTCNEVPPVDPLNQLMWAKQVLHGSQIELRVERDTIRLVPLPPPDEVPLEACRDGDFEVSPLGTAGNTRIVSFSGDDPRTILHHTGTGSFAFPT
jgi:hypothetical protein